MATTNVPSKSAKSDDKAPATSSATPVGQLNLRSDEQPVGPPMVFATAPWPQRVAFDAAFLSKTDGVEVFRDEKLNGDVASVTVANGSALYLLDAPVANSSTRNGTLQGEPDFEPAPAGPSPSGPDKQPTSISSNPVPGTKPVQDLSQMNMHPEEAEDPKMVALRSGLEAPGHAIGDKLAFSHERHLREAGMRQIVVDNSARVWAIEENANPAEGEDDYNLVLVGRLS